MGFAARPGTAVPDVEAFGARKAPLLDDLGYEAVHELDTWHAHERRSAEGARYNLHVKPVDGDEHRWDENLLLRDYLRDHPEVAAEYESLKRDLADEYDDVAPYSEGKSAFIADVVDRARSAGYAYEAGPSRDAGGTPRSPTE